MTIVFSAVLGAFALALVVLMFHKCKHKIQYLHQPLNNAGKAFPLVMHSVYRIVSVVSNVLNPISFSGDEFVAEDDTLVISGGLYDGHPIYDNVPTAPDDQSQFRLQLFH